MFARMTGSTYTLVLATVLGVCYGPGWPGSTEENKAVYAGKSVILCGASYGIGAELAYGLAAAGADLVLVARSEDKLRAVAEKCKVSFTD